jgi:alpha-aminoadipate carrier protein LysW
MVTVRKAVTVSCLDCERPFDLTFKPVEGQIITCPFCESELEVINTDPLELDFYFEDWDSDEEWDADAESDDDDDFDDDDEY